MWGLEDNLKGLFSPTMWAPGIKHAIMLSSKYLYPTSHLTSPSCVLLILARSDITPCLNLTVISSKNIDKYFFLH